MSIISEKSLRMALVFKKFALLTKKNYPNQIEIYKTINILIMKNKICVDLDTQTLKIIIIIFLFTIQESKKY